MAQTPPTTVRLPPLFITNSAHQVCYQRAIPNTTSPTIQSRMPSREATHAGSWYSDHEPTLSSQLEKWLAQVPDELPGIGRLPIAGARVIIAPYASVLLQRIQPKMAFSSSIC
ncbi:conserved hypothetical protein [Histoplasma capsulatum var. duboisii H88]|uniref:Uncharacterized protein n=1 Tax=Ajellomyces capsulatus (strain H88) TaxID=544711 RepID=F0US28_AJEC8|nr:conserved hypothetical protein [Histoplasma capsulatum var. duboisii H88]